jgi:hypothetical protein
MSTLTARTSISAEARGQLRVQLLEAIVNALINFQPKENDA